MFSMLTQWCSHLPRPSQKKASILLLQLFISFCLPQISRHAMVWLHTKRVPEERRKQKQGSWDHCLEIAYQPQPCQHQVTLGSRHADGDFSRSGSTRCACTIYNSFHCCPASWSSSQRLRSLISEDGNVLGLKFLK